MPWVQVPHLRPKMPDDWWYRGGYNHHQYRGAGYEVPKKWENVIVKEKPVLDVACGGRMFYFDKNDPRVLFCDNRTVDTTLCDGRHFSVMPDRQCDFTNLPFEDQSFRLVVFDPPHLLYSHKKEATTPHKAPTGYQHIKYGSLEGNWKETLRKGFSECFRVLEHDGVLIFKWNETDIPVKEILSLTPEKPLFGNRSGKASKTHWLCFLKK